MFKEIWDFLLGGKKKKSAIIEPPGGIDGMIWKKVRVFAVMGYKVTRIAWPKDEFVVSENGRFVKYKGCTKVNIDFRARNADYVSCDWQVVGKKDKK